MGADGGVVYIPLRNPSDKNYERVTQLLQPFWQFLNRDGCAHWAEEAHWEWEQNNSIDPPKYVLGYYGTDRVDDLELGDLPEICDVPDRDDAPYQGYLYDLTFSELDLECRTTMFPITGSYYGHPLHKLWHKHFHWSSREEVISNLGSLLDMKIEDWAKELNNLLFMNQVVHEETWT